MDRGTPRAIRLQDYAPPAFLIDTADLAVDLGEDRTEVTARLAMRRNPARQDAAGAPLVLDGQELETMSVRVDGRELAAGDYVLGAEDLTIGDLPGSFVLETRVAIRPQDNTALEGLYKSGGMFCTQCEAEGFRRITWFLDRPDVMAVYRVAIEADAARYPVLLSNGNRMVQEDLGQGRHRAVWEDPFPKPSYLFALVAGDLRAVRDTFVTRSGRSVALDIWVEPGNEDKCGHAMESLKKAMAWDEQVYGLEYDLDVFNIVAVGDFNMGAMENKSLNIFNTKYVLARPDTATDTDFQDIETVVAHEYFHNWTGNRVTCRDWFQLSLKEGLTVFRDQQFSADMNSAAVNRIADVQRLRAAQFPEDAGPMAHPVRPESYIEINNFYTPTVYEKGAEVVRMIHTLVGPDGFRKGMDLYFERHDGQAVTCYDFVAAMADATGTDLTQFKRWYSQAGTPQLRVSWRHDPEAATLTLSVQQSTPPTPGQPEKLPLHIPFAIGLVGPDGEALPVTLEGENAPGPDTRVLPVTAATQTFVLTGLREAPMPSLLRGFSAPVRLQAGYTDEELAFLMAHDADRFARWEAGQTLATRVLMAMVDKYAAGRQPALPGLFVAAYAAQLADTRDPAYAAKALTLPGEGTLAQERTPVDVDGIHAARKAAYRDLGTALGDTLRHTYEAMRNDGPFSLSAAAMGRRALKSPCLALLTSTDERPAIELCLAQLRAGEGMTDTIAALSLLADTDAPEREEELDRFDRTWRHDALVMDKWFGIHAMADRPDVLDTVHRLLDHPAFSIRNPNKVRALIGSFAAGNPVHFHRVDGSCYRFLADRVLELDRLNPQTAARLVGPLQRWRRYDAGRQALMRAELERIAGRSGLSRDVYEIVSKALAD